MHEMTTDAPTTDRPLHGKRVLVVFNPKSGSGDSELPEFNRLPQAIKNAWLKAAEAVAKRVTDQPITDQR